MSEKIALGFCNNVDYEIVWDAEALEDLVLHYGIRAHELITESAIHSERDLVISILHFMRASSGSERFVANSEMIEAFARRFDKRITLGGTSVRAAIAMRVMGHRSALHLITQNDQVRRLIPADSPTVCSNDRDATHPHLIVQYPKDAVIRAGDIHIRARQPNRLIYHCNVDRINMNLNEDFADLIAEAQVLLISGFNAMQSTALLAKRLEAVGRMLARLPAEATVFLEDGAYFDSSYRQLIFQALGHRIDVHSLNEDELQIHLGRSVALRDVQQVKAAMAELGRNIPAPTIVAHTQHWALAQGRDARRFPAALKAGVTMATTRFRHGDNFTPADFHRIERREPSAENARFAESINATSDQMVCVPVADVDQENATTIGLGDAFVGGFLPALLR